MIPKTVNIKGEIYQVKFQDLEPNLMGECDKNRKIIYISKNNCKTKQEKADTFIHEVAHAYIHEIYLDANIPYYVEEAFCLTVEDIFKKHLAQYKKIVK